MKILRYSVFGCLVMQCFLIRLPGAQGQTKIIDSLKRLIVKSRTTPEKLNAIFLLCDQGYTLHSDTLLLYAGKALSIARKLRSSHDIAEAMYLQSSALTAKGLIDSALSEADNCLTLIAGKINDPLLVANIYNQKGRCYMRMNKYKEAINMGYHVIELGENSLNELLQLKGKTLIGWAYLEMGQIKEALTWHLKALHTTSDTVLLEKYSILYANLAINYNSLGKVDSAIYFIDKAIKFSRKNENLFALSNSLAIQAQIYVKSGQGKLAESPLKEVVQIRKLIGDPFYIVSDMSQLSLYYAHYGQPQKGIALCNEGIAIAKQYKLETKLFFLYSTLAENYKALGNDVQYSGILEKIINLKDSVYQLNSAEALAEMQAKYDLQKQESIIIRQKYGLVTKTYLIYASLILVALGGIISMLLFKNYKRKKSMQLGFMRDDEKRRSFIAVTEAEEHERKRIAADLHDNMGAFASAIIADVDEIFLAKEEINDNDIMALKNSATEIMSNLRDTIWALNKNKIQLTAISDRFKNYLHKIEETNSGLIIELNEHIHNDVEYSAVLALNIFRILQEGVSNALKQGDCQAIRIWLTSEDNISILIEHNCGSIKAGTSVDRNHIKNIEARSKDSGFTVTMTNNGEWSRLAINQAVGKSISEGGRMQSTVLHVNKLG